MLYNNPHANLLLPDWPALAASSAAAARSGGCQFAGITLLHPPLHLLLCATRQSFSQLHALGGPKRGGANRPFAASVLQPAAAEGLQA